MRLILDKIKEKVLFFLFNFSAILYVQGKEKPKGPGLGARPGTPIDSYEIILIVVALSFIVGYYFYRRRQLLSLGK